MLGATSAGTRWHHPTDPPGCCRRPLTGGPPLSYRRRRLSRRRCRCRRRWHCLGPQTTDAATLANDSATRYCDSMPTTNSLHIISIVVIIVISIFGRRRHHHHHHNHYGHYCMHWLRLWLMCVCVGVCVCF